MIFLLLLVLVTLSYASYSLGEANGYAKARKDWGEVIKTKEDTIVSLQRTLDEYLR